MESVNERAEKWLASPYVKEEDKETIRHMSKEEKDDAFYRDIEFGTAGMRGVLGPGTNRLNEFTLRRASVAYARALLEKYGDEAKKRGVVISHDNRFHSRDFSEEAASIFNEMGIKAYLFDSLRPTPELSFAVRYLHCIGGVMITASHNPKQYNGYKVYDDKGCQLVPEKIAPVLEIIKEYPDLLGLKVPSAEAKGETVILGPEVDDAYVAEVKKVQINPDLPKRGFKIVYSPQHGASYENAVRLFKELGYEVHPVLSQCTHDPAFGGTLSPNPENPDAYIESLKLAKEIGADLVVMTDPDGDRVGLAYLSSQGDYRLLTGNESGALLLEYVLSERKRHNDLPADAVMYDTVVTSDLGRKIAKAYGVKNESFLTGFKFIGDAIARKEEAHIPSTFVFGYEESYGCLLAPFVRDKDGLQAILLYCEMVLWHLLGNRRLDEAFDDLMRHYGYHVARGYSLEFPGSEGSRKMQTMMDELHAKAPSKIGNTKVIRVEDYEKGTYLEGGKEGKLTIPKSELVKLFLENGSSIAVRPSGTEPKIKFYVEAVAPKGDGLLEKSKALYNDIKKELGA